MPYSTLSDLKKKIDEAVLIQLTDTAGAGVIDEDKVSRAISGADALIDSHVGKVYAVPLAPAPQIVSDMSADIAIAKLHEFRSLGSAVWQVAHERAVTLLEKIAQGAVTLDGVSQAPAPSQEADTAGFSSAPRRFSRESMKGM